MMQLRLASRTDTDLDASPVAYNSNQELQQQLEEVLAQTKEKEDRLAMMQLRLSNVKESCHDERSPQDAHGAPSLENETITLSEMIQILGEKEARRIFKQAKSNRQDPPQLPADESGSWCELTEAELSTRIALIEEETLKKESQLAMAQKRLWSHESSEAWSLQEADHTSKRRRTCQRLDHAPRIDFGVVPQGETASKALGCEYQEVRLGGESSVWSSYVMTVGKGLHRYAEEEVITRLKATETRAVLGKVFFSTRSKPQELLSLRSCERVMAVITCQENWRRRHADETELIDIVLSILGCGSTDAGVEWRKALQLVLDARKLKSAPVGVTYRLNIKISNDLKASFYRENLIKAVSSLISKQTDWMVNLHTPTVDIALQISTERILLAMPLSEKPVSSYLRFQNENQTQRWETGLRGPMAWAIGRAAQVTSGATVLDPMCGAGHCLIESAMVISDAQYIGLDIDPQQVARAQTNLMAADLKGSIRVSAGNACEIPLEDGSIDAIVCDMPFNYQHACDVGTEYPKFLKEMARVAKDGALAALLSSISSMGSKAGKEWIQEEEPLETSLGTTTAFLHTLRRRSRQASRYRHWS